MFRFEAPLYYANSEIFMRLAQRELGKVMAAQAAHSNGGPVEEAGEKDTTRLSQKNLSEKAGTGELLFLQKFIDRLGF